MLKKECMAASLRCMESMCVVYLDMVGRYVYVLYLREQTMPIIVTNFVQDRPPSCAHLSTISPPRSGSPNLPGCRRWSSSPPPPAIIYARIKSRVVASPLGQRYQTPEHNRTPASRQVCADAPIRYWDAPMVACSLSSHGLLEKRRQNVLHTAVHARANCY